jgi:hypothetical protein
MPVEESMGCIVGSSSTGSPLQRKRQEENQTKGEDNWKKELEEFSKDLNSIHGEQESIESVRSDDAAGENSSW